MEIERSAAGKVILCGEHSVVYGRPAIAVPVSGLRARATVMPAAPGQGVYLVACDLDREYCLDHECEPGEVLEEPLLRTAQLTLEYLHAPPPDVTIQLCSELPIASGMGSGAAVTVAVARALGAYLGHELPPEVLSALTYEVEKIYHGNPSGIDNTVIAWERPVYFIKGKPPETFRIAEPFQLLIANSGISTSTRAAIEEVRQRWVASPDYYNVIFDCIGAIAKAARDALEQGAHRALGTLLNENQELLGKMGLSTPQLDRLIQAARDAGALGAKLTGAGQGGNVIVLVTPERMAAVQAALQHAGAIQTWHTQVGGRQATLRQENHG